MGIKVAKFGGSSVADAIQIQKVKRIVEADPERRFIVPSAPGKRTPEDKKITDLLYLCHQHSKQSLSFDSIFALITERYEEIIGDLGLSLDLSPYLNEVKRDIAGGASNAYTASRGEYLNGPIIAQLLGYDFVDAAEIIRFDKHGQFDPEKTNQLITDRLSQHKCAVIPGFYGAMPDGSIKTFTRGGSDITGALIALGVKADVYENWTDVSGLLMADPRVVTDPKPIDILTFRELRELAYMGATVLHEEAVFPVRKANIPVHILNTNKPEDPGTRIVPDAQPISHKGTITGIAGRKKFSVIVIEKSMMNAEIGFGRRVLSILAVNGISFEHMPSGIDTLSVVVADSQLAGKRSLVLEQLEVECMPDSLEIFPDMALIATVGRGMAKTPGSAARLFSALAKNGINIRMIDQGSSEINIIIGVYTRNFEKAMQAIYNAFA